MAIMSHTHSPCRPYKARRASILDLLAVYRQRRALARLTPEALEDLGITREEADAEAQRPLWDIAATGIK